jgi:CxxC motif-containing protein (DUF1111 family)
MEGAEQVAADVFGRGLQRGDGRYQPVIQHRAGRDYQRLLFLHDGRTTNLLQAIIAHPSGGFFFGSAPSEANAVIDEFLELSASNQQAILNFLRSL